MISRLKPDNVKVLSLTTIATPHRGSAFADYMFETIGCRYLENISQHSLTPGSTLRAQVVSNYGILWFGNRGLFPIDPHIHARRIQRENPGCGRHQVSLSDFLRRSTVNSPVDTIHMEPAWSLRRGLSLLSRIPSSSSRKAESTMG